MMSSVEINSLRELNKLNDIKSGYFFPSLFQGKLSDPNSWSQWMYSFTGMGFDKNPDNVIDFLDRVITDLSDEIKGKELTGEQCISLYKSCGKLRDLSRSIKVPDGENNYIGDNLGKLSSKLYKAFESREDMKKYVLNVYADPCEIS